MRIYVGMAFYDANDHEAICGVGLTEEGARVRCEEWHRDRLKHEDPLQWEFVSEQSQAETPHGIDYAVNVYFAADAPKRRDQ